MKVRYAITDIHGNARAFLKLLDHVDPDPEQMVILGDLGDRGLQTFEVYEEVSLLMEEGCRVIRGNHDEWYEQHLNAKSTYFLSDEVGGSTTVKSFENAVQKHGYSKVEGIRRNVFRNLMPYLETEDFIFVHAGIDPRLPDMSRQTSNTLQFGCDAWRNPTLEHSFDQVVVFGHTPTYSIHKNISEDDATVWFSRARRKMAIDTGAGFGNRLTMVDLQKGKAYAYDFAERDIIDYQFMNPKGFRRRYY